MHQTVIGQEAVKQMENAGDMPDIVVAPFGGGSNFAGISFPFLRLNFDEGRNIRCIASEPSSCPKLTRGVFRYNFGDTVGMTPLLPMYTLGHNFVPAPIHAGGLRYHGAGVIVSQLLKDKLIEARAHDQLECFEAGLLFAKTEGILPAPETTHALATAFQEAERCKREGKAETCQVYNDVFAVRMDPSPLPPDNPMTPNIAFEKTAGGQLNVIGVNNQSFLTACTQSPQAPGYVNCKGEVDLQGSGFENHAASAWLRSLSPVTPGSVIRLRFAIWDSSDGVFDSTVVVGRLPLARQGRPGRHRHRALTARAPRAI